MDIVTLVAVALITGAVGTLLGHAAGYAKGIDRGARWIINHPARPETTDSETGR